MLPFGITHIYPRIFEYGLSNFVENPENLVKIMLSDDSLDKISTLFIFIVVILFVGGGIIFTLEKNMERYAI